MEQNQEVINAADEYARSKATLGLGDNQVDYKQVYDAFLAGVEWLRERWTRKPDVEYYGF